MRFLPALLAAVLLPVVAGCGGQTGAAGGAASAVPANVAVYVSADASFEGDQWRAVTELLARFPDGEGALEELLDEATAEAGLEEDVELRDVLGPEVALAVLDGSAGADGEPPVVILTQPDDPDAFQQLLEDGDQASAEIRGWQVVAQDEAVLERYREALDGPSLEESEAYAETMDDLPGEALARVYVNGEALAEAVPELSPDLQAAPLRLLAGGEAASVGAALRAEGDGLRVEGRVLSTGDAEAEPYQAELPEEIPGDVLVFVSFNDLGGALSRYGGVLGGAGILGFDLDEVGSLFSGESAVYVRAGKPQPAVTLVTRVEDEAAALQAVEALVALAGDEAPIVYDAFDGLLAVSTSEQELAALRGDGARLDQDDRFEQALDGAGMPGETTGFGYVDVKAAAPLFLGLSGASGAAMPEVDEYLESLGGLVFWGSGSGDVQRFSAFLGID